MIDYGAMHNYMSVSQAKSLGLKMDLTETKFKVVIVVTRKVSGEIQNAIMRTGSWQAPVNLVAIEMEEFDLILGQAYLRQEEAIVAPYLGCILILDPTRPCMILIV